MCLPNSFTFCPLARPAFMSWHQISLVSRLWAVPFHPDAGTAGKLPVGSGGGDEKEKCLASSCPVGQNGCRGDPAENLLAGVGSPAAHRGGVLPLHGSVSAFLFTKGTKTVFRLSRRRGQRPLLCTSCPSSMPGTHSRRRQLTPKSCLLMVTRALWSPICVHVCMCVC